ncbi:MAG: hypothetical protein MUD01_00820 [Chloroflexaceae bacterium]|nr:hypothetical protein [Chloroflexaceae bacterium]
MTELPALNLDSLRSVDSLPITGTSLEMIDMAKVASHIRRSVEGGRYNGPTEPLEYLVQRQCVVPSGEGYLLSLAGLLCFGHEPQATFPRGVIDIGHYRGLDPLTYEVIHLEKNIGGTIFDQLARVETYVWGNIHHGMTLSERSFQRVEVHEYPRAVVRELCVNMLAHRDYTNFRSAARVQLFRNRIEWISPGGLPPGVTVENILFEQSSRNPTILSILYEAGYVEAFGQGLNTVVAVLGQEGMSAPTFQDTGASFIVTVYGRSLDLFYGGGAYTQLNESQRKILALLRSRGALSPRELIASFGNRARRSIQRDMRGLVEAGLITSSGEGRALLYQLQTTPSEE